MFDDIVKYIVAEWRVIASAPVTFILAAAVIAMIVWWALSWGYGRENSLLRSQVADYKDKLSGATPVEAKAKIDALEKTIKLTIGFPWVPLTPIEIAALAAEAEKIEKRPIQVMYLNAYGKELAKTFEAAFTRAGWTVNFSMGGGFEDGIFVGRSRSTSVLLKQAIEKTTILRPQILGRADEEYGPQGAVFVAVGTNSN
jgi:hypothetical protein